MSWSSAALRWARSMGVASAWLVTAHAGADVIFKGVGSFPEVPFSRVFGISADGSTVVGDGLRGDSVREAFRWTNGIGLSGLGILPDGTFSIAKATTPTANVIVGVSDGDYGTRAVTWTPQNGVQSIGEPPPSWETVSAGGVSADGKVVVGQLGVPGVRFRGFVWTQDGGYTVLSDPNSDTSFLVASAASGTGSFVVGTGRYQGVGQAVGWTRTAGMFGLGLLPDAVYGSANAVTPDGSVVVGDCLFSLMPPIPEEAFRWTPSGGMQSLGDLAGGDRHSFATDVSADGAVIVGGASTEEGNVAFIWDAPHGMRNLQDVLIHEYGADLDGWTLTQAAALSDDGLAITGNGINPDGNQEGWVVYLPEPSSLVLLIAIWGLAGRRGVR